MADKLCLLVCQTFKPEVDAVIAAAGWKNVTTAGFQGTCLRELNAIPSLQQAIGQAKDCEDLHLLGGCSLARSEAVELVMAGRHWYRLEQCFYLLTNREIIDSYIREGAYLLTPGWLARWREWIGEWGFDQETARLFFAESASRLLLLDTGSDPNGEKHLRDLADFVQLPAGRLPVGLDHLRLIVEAIIAQRQHEQALLDAKRALNQATRRAADYAMALEMFGALAQTAQEADVIQAILDLASILFAPGVSAYQAWEDGRPGPRICRPEPAGDEENLPVELVELQEAYAWTPSGLGFLVRIARHGETVGTLLVDEIAFPERREQYLNLALGMAEACALAIDNARTYQQIRQVDERLQRYAGDLEQVNHEVRQFSAIISHDLRTPLVNLKGFAGEVRCAAGRLRVVLDDLLPQFTAQQRQTILQALDRDIPEALGYIESSITFMQRFVNAVLAMSQLGRQELKPEPIDMNELAQSILATLSHQLREKQAVVVVGSLPEVVADRTALQQIMSNLLSNAVKFLAADRPGHIVISGERGQNEVAFHVRDNGRGIAAHETERVFAPFRRAGRPDTPGEGMGLPYVQILVRRHGGRVWFTSEPDVGSTFSFTIPSPPPNPPDNSTAANS